MLLNFYVCVWNYEGVSGLSPTTFENLADAEAFADQQRPAGMQAPLLMSDLLNRFAIDGRAEEFRAMFASLNHNYADPRLLDLRDYIRDQWAM
jgi:hypothetical protein